MEEIRYLRETTTLSLQSAQSLVVVAALLLLAYGRGGEGEGKGGRKKQVTRRAFGVEGKDGKERRVRAKIDWILDVRWTQTYQMCIMSFTHVHYVAESRRAVPHDSRKRPRPDPRPWKGSTRMGKAASVASHTGREPIAGGREKKESYLTSCASSDHSLFGTTRPINMPSNHLVRRPVVPLPLFPFPSSPSPSPPVTRNTLTPSPDRTPTRPETTHRHRPTRLPSDVWCVQ